MSQQMVCRGRATAIFTEQGYTKVVYHDTVVVKFNENEIILNSGGWRTNTTKTRMIQASNQFDLGYTVFQKDFEWFVDYKGYEVPFHDGMVLNRNIVWKGGN